MTSNDLRERAVCPVKLQQFEGRQVYVRIRNIFWYALRSLVHGMHAQGLLALWYINAAKVYLHCMYMANMSCHRL
jgi:hypothetical protein